MGKVCGILNKDKTQKMIPNNIFGLLADFVHLCSYFVIIQKIRSLKETSELSYRTQEIYLLVY